MKKIKIIHFVSGLKSGGVESMIIGFARHLVDTCEFTIVYQHAPDKKCYQKMEEAGCKLIRVPSKSTHPLKNMIAISKILKRGRYDIIHSHMNLTSWIPLMIAKVKRIPNRISHSHIAMDEGVGKGYSIFAWFCKKMIKISAEYYLACGDDAAQYMYGEKSNYVVIHNAIEIESFKFDITAREKYRRELGIENKYVIGHIGRFTEQKNHLFIIDIFEELWQQDKDACLLLIGSGERYKEVYTYVKKRKSKSNILFLGNRNDVCQLLHAMDALILPSLFEGFPVVSVEAQTSGVNCFFADTVDLKCRVLDNVEFLSIRNGATIWVSRLLERKNNYIKRSDAWKFIKEEGYDIVSESTKLRKLYLDILK